MRRAHPPFISEGLGTLHAPKFRTNPTLTSRRYSKQSTGLFYRMLGNNHRKCQTAHSGIVSGRQGLGQARTLARRLYKKTPSLVCSTRDDVNRGTTLFQSILSALRSHCVKYCYTNIRLNAQTAFRRKTPILKLQEGSRGMLSADDTPSLGRSAYSTHICS